MNYKFSKFNPSIISYRYISYRHSLKRKKLVLIFKYYFRKRNVLSNNYDEVYYDIQ